MAIIMNKVFAALLLFLTAAAAVQACTPQCTGCNAFGPYWNGQGCGKGSHQVMATALAPGTDHTACCSACAKSKCCLFWVYDPANNYCKGYSNCNRVDGQPTVREWLGDWKKLPTTCPGYSKNPNAQIEYPGLHDPKDKPWPVGNNAQVKGN